MAKKKTVGNVIELDLPQTVEVVKKKKEMSDKQRENLSKGMAILKAKREAKSKKQEVEVAEAEEPVVAPVAPVTPVAPPVAVVAPEPVAPVVKKERKPRVVKNYLTTEDFNSFKSELLTTLKPGAVAPQPIVAPSIIQPVVQPVVMKERVISGRELLDKIFFK
jgi:hypothetical protein